MGRKPKFLTVPETCKILGVTRQSVNRFAAAGLLHAQRKERRGVTRGSAHRGAAMYPTEEVYALLDARMDKRVDLPTLYMKVFQAVALGQALEQRMSRVENLLGLNDPILSYEKNDVLSEYLRAHSLKNAESIDINSVLEFAGVLRSIHDEFLDLVERYTEDHQPWRVFLAASSRLQQVCARAQVADLIETMGAQAELRAARSKFERVAFLYIWSKEGKQAAYRCFPSADPDAHRRVMNRLLTPGSKDPGKN